MSKKIFIITGEFSGDKHAAGVARELKKIMPDCIIEGVGESNLEMQGVKLFRNHDKMAKMGLTPSVIFNHLRLGIDIVNYLKNEYKPDLVLLVDYGAFNLQISKQLHKAGIKTFYFIPPQIWASRKWRLKTIKKNVDKVLTIFPFEKEFYDREGIEAEFVGHPIMSELPECTNREDFIKRHNLDSNKKLIGVFPGSRIFEIKFLLNIFIKTAQ
ncbi:lipid-A-disaccharide synthase, partial [bacterium]|nr:lipid-A-disaccharide synthase [bacterium]